MGLGRVARAARRLVSCVLIAGLLAAVIFTGSSAAEARQTGSMSSEPGVTQLPTEPARQLAAAREEPPCDVLERTVVTSFELSIAIDCYNLQMPAGSHTITLGADLSYASGAPFITQSDPAFSLTIEGAGFRIDGPGANTEPTFVYALFVLQGASSLNLNDVTLANADAYPLYVFAPATAVTVDGSVFEDNGDNAVLLGGDVEITDTQVTGSQDAGIRVVDGSVSIADSAISQNAVQGLLILGGAVEVTNTMFDDNGANGMQVEGGTATLSASTITGSTGIANAGVVVFGGSVVVSNSTITNLNFSAVWVPAGSAHVANTTIAFTGSGIQQDGGSVSVSSVLLADNGGFGCVGIIDVLHTSYASDFSCGTGFVLLFLGSVAPLASNGGPTDTIPLLPTSNAIGGGECTQVPVGHNAAGAVVFGDLEFDQRGVGFPRTAGANCDAGSFEVSLQSAFVDVNPAAFYADAVTFAAARGITTGTTDTTFAPNVIVNRAQMATFLWRFFGEQDPTGANPFVDVPPGRFYTTAVIWLAETGITTGTTPTTFSPLKPLSRAEMATFLWRASGEPVPTAANPFVDVPPGRFFTTAVIWLAETGVTTGTTATTFSPGDALPRSQAVTFLHRVVQIPQS